jgi:hypothetical protein
MRNKLICTAVLLVLAAALSADSAQAYPLCSCSCSSSCTATCVGSGGLTNCGTIGLCSSSPSCGGGGCDAVVGGGGVFLSGLLQQPAVVAVGASEGRAAAKLTWRLMQLVHEQGLGEVYTANGGFVISDGLGNVRSPELTFVSRDHAGLRAPVPTLVAEFLSPAKPAAAAHVDAQAWLKAGAQAVVVIDAENHSVAVYRGTGGTPEVTGAGGTIDLSDAVPGWTLKLDDLFE